MTDETTAALKEIAALMKRQIEQQEDAAVRRNEEMRERFGQRQGGFAGIQNEMRERQQEFQKRREEFQSKMEKGREEFAEQRREDREFKARLLAELQRHNQLLEALVKRLDSRGL